MKRYVILFSCLMVVLLSLSLLSPKAQAAANGTCGDNLTWELYGGRLTVFGTGPMYNYSYTNGSRAPWWDVNQYIYEVVIEEGVTTIGDWTFNGCGNLKCVTIADSVVSIGWSAFNGCYDLLNVKFGSGLVTIGDLAFYGCMELENIVIPDTVQTISKAAFYQCIKLRKVYIPDSVMTIGDWVFDCCDNLHEVYYAGNTSQWRRIFVGVDNDALTNAVIHYNHAHNYVDGFCVCSAEEPENTSGIAGDMNGDGIIDNDDVVCLMWHNLFPEQYPITGGDINGDGIVDNDDVVYLMWHNLFPENYPL